MARSWSSTPHSRYKRRYRSKIDSGKWLMLGLGLVAGGAIIYVALRKLSLQALVPISANTFSNLEEWEIVRDERGRMIAMRIKREAKHNAS